MEGPSLVILREELEPLVGRKVRDATGNSRKIELDRIRGRILKSARSWGKHLVLEFSGGYRIRVHFLMYGSYRIDDRKDGREPRLRLGFAGGREVNFYSCSILPAPEVYDWSLDPMSEAWSELRAVRALEREPETYVCDALMDQGIFAGVGNIIKNEVLFRLGLHPLTRLGELDRRRIRQLVRETRKYCWEFYEWKKRFELKKHWKIYRRRACAECGAKPVFGKTGKGQRVSFVCPNCQARGAVAAA